MNYTEVLQNAKTRIDNAKCKACPVCNGLACRNTIPGPGAKGVGDTAIRNYQKWQEIRVNMDTLFENKPVDMSVNLFGRQFSYPFFAGPVGAVELHYSDYYDELTYNNILVSACADNGIAAFTGDGLNPQVMIGATEESVSADRNKDYPDYLELAIMALGAEQSRRHEDEDIMRKGRRRSM